MISWLRAPLFFSLLYASAIVAAPADRTLIVIASRCETALTGQIPFEQIDLNDIFSRFSDLDLKLMMPLMPVAKGRALGVIAAESLVADLKLSPQKAREVFATLYRKQDREAAEQERMRFMQQFEEAFEARLNAALAPISELVIPEASAKRLTVLGLPLSVETYSLMDVWQRQDVFSRQKRMGFLFGQLAILADSEISIEIFNLFADTKEFGEAFSKTLNRAARESSEPEIVKAARPSLWSRLGAWLTIEDENGPEISNELMAEYLVREMRSIENELNIFGEKAQWTDAYRKVSVKFADGLESFHIGFDRTNAAKFVVWALNDNAAKLTQEEFLYFSAGLVKRLVNINDVRKALKMLSKISKNIGFWQNEPFVDFATPILERYCGPKDDLVDDAAAISRQSVCDEIKQLLMIKKWGPQKQSIADYAVARERYTRGKLNDKDFARVTELKKQLAAVRQRILSLRMRLMLDGAKPQQEATPE